jgi:hypothetical protein
MLLSTIHARVARSARALLAVALLLTATHQSASAQQAARSRVAVDAASRAVQPSRPFSFRPAPAAPDTVEQTNPVAHGAKVGALIGAAAGLVYTLALNITKNCTEQNNVACDKDQHDYRTFTYPIYGGALGAVVGAVIGSARR